MSAHRFLVAVAALAIGIYFSGYAAGPDPMTRQARAFFEWFNSLLHPDLKGCPYVRVATGEWGRIGDEPARQIFTEAFLLETNDSSFSVFALDLLERTFTLTNPTINEQFTRPEFEVLGLSGRVKEVLVAFRNPPSKEDERRRFGSLLTDPSEVFTLAWACWRKGMDSDAQRLYEQALKMPLRGGSEEKPSEYRQDLEYHLGFTMFWGAVGSFEDTAVSRPQLLAQFETIVSNNQRSQYVERAAQFAGVLKRMVSEDEAHAKLALTNLDRLPVEQRVHELIFRLRDQNGGHLFSIPFGSSDIFDDGCGSTNSPAHQLVKLGYAAVPQLIAALDEPAFSRTITSGKYVESQSVVTVGDCAKTILDRIAGTNFPDAPKSSDLSKGADRSATKRAVEAWWAESQNKPEKQVLPKPPPSNFFSVNGDISVTREAVEFTLLAMLLYLLGCWHFRRKRGG